jgi:hypothetical protein
MVQQQRRIEREKFAWTTQRRHKKRLVYLKNMAELPPFELWLFNVVVNAMAVGEDVVEDMVSISIGPLDLATSYRSMCAFGNHLWVVSVEAHLSTLDSSVATTFEQECRYRSNDWNPIMASIEYVGWIEEILELDYGWF